MEKMGWIRDEMRNSYGVCSLGAIEYGLKEELFGSTPMGQVPIKDRMAYGELARNVTTALAQVLPEGQGSAPNQVINWNDVVAKDRQEVLDTFAKAEKIERAGFDPDA